MRRREFLRALTGGATTAFAAGAAGLGAGPLGSAESRAATAADAPAAAAPVPPRDRKPVTLRVMTFNIHHAEGTDKRLDLDRIARVIRAAEPDLVALQEVDRDTTRTGRVDQAARLGALTKMWAVFGKSIDYQGGEYGNAVLSRHPLADPAVRPLPGKPGEEKRSLLTVTVTLPGGRTIRLAATHLNHRDAAERLAQAKGIVELLSGGRPAGEPAAVPTLLAGDLNAEPGEASIQALLESFADVSHGGGDPERAGEPDAKANKPGGAMLTYPDDKPRKRIDYVLAGPAAAWRAVSATALDPQGASDHRPVVSVVELV